MKISSHLYCKIKSSGCQLEHCPYDGQFVARITYTLAMLDCPFVDAINLVLSQIYDMQKCFNALPSDDKSGILLMTSLENRKLEGMVYFGAHIENKKNQFYPTPTGPGSILEVKLLAVDPQAKGKGLGTKLLACVVDVARINNIHSVILNSAGESKSFYERNNLMMMGDSDFYYPGRTLFVDRPYSRLLELIGVGGDFIDVPVFGSGSAYI
ncbi:GNAT family N-acetyltransferase [Kistimonas asteriae]|uniref:GNAT family N-acetyltransferase n=1 Tax=Kistimonas asteriae TaxID=517724 RepID=UPI001BA6A0FA|nr:GNAT family N-acetyltransferase [Kistimonas asteriae]